MIPARGAAYPLQVLHVPLPLIFAFFAVVLVIIVIGSLSLFGLERFSLAEWKLGRRLRRAARVSLADATDGMLVKVVGTLRYPPDVELLRAPISNRACCYHHVFVGEQKLVGRSAKLINLVDEGSSLPSCLIEADGKTAIVELAGAEVLLDLDRLYTSGLLEGGQRPPLLAPFLAAHGIDSKGVVFDRRIVCNEGILQQGERIVVLARCVRELDPTADARTSGYREAPTRLRLVAPPDAPLLLSDRRRLTR